MATIKSLRIMMYVDHSRVKAGLKNTEDKIKHFQKRMAQLIVGSFAAEKIGRAFMSSLQNAIKMEKLGVELAVLGGGGNLFNELTEKAMASPFPIEDWLAGGKRLLGVEVPAKQVGEILEMLGNLAAGTGARIADLGLIFTQVFAKGRLQGEEVLQFMERNISLNKALQKNLGKTKQELQKMQEAGEITPQMMIDAMRTMTTGDGVYAGMMTAIMGTTFGQLQALKNIWTQMSTEVGRILLPAVGLLLHVISEAIKPGNVLSWTFRTMATSVAIIVGIVAGLLYLLMNISTVVTWVFVEAPKQFIQLMTSFVSGIVSTVFGVFNAIAGVLKFVLDVIAYVPRKFSNFLSQFLGLIGRIPSFFVGMVSDIIGLVGSAVAAVPDMILSAFTGVYDTIAGMVSGPLSMLNGLLATTLKYAFMILSALVGGGIAMVAIGAIWAAIVWGAGVFNIELGAAIASSLTLAGVWGIIDGFITSATFGMNKLVALVIYAATTAVAFLAGWTAFDWITDKFTKIKEDMEETAKQAGKIDRMGKGGGKGALFGTREAYNIISGDRNLQVQLKIEAHLRELVEIEKKENEFEAERRREAARKAMRKLYEPSPALKSAKGYQRFGMSQ